MQSCCGGAKGFQIKTERLIKSQILKESIGTSRPQKINILASSRVKSQTFPHGVGRGIFREVDVQVEHLN